MSDPAPVHDPSRKGAVAGLLALLGRPVRRAPGREGVVVDADTGHMLHAVLGREGWIVQAAGGGVEALDRMLRVPHHVVILDLIMPVMDGIASLERLRATPGRSDISVAVLSVRRLAEGRSCRAPK